MREPRIRFSEIDRCLARRIRTEFGSPVYIMDEAGIYERFDQFKSATLSMYPQSTVAVSYKTNPTRGLLAELHRRGAYAEVVSGDEIRVALSLEMPRSKIIFNGPAKSDDDLEMVIHQGCFLHCDHADEVGRIEVIAKRKRLVAKIGVRLYFPADESWERFGFWADVNDPRCHAFSIIRQITASPHLELCGLHSHFGTNIRELEKFQRFSSVYAAFAEKLRAELGIELCWLDVGGGLAGMAPLVSEHQKQPHTLPSVHDYCRAVVAPLLPYLQSCRCPPRLFFEPGRTLFNAFGGILVTVIGRRPAGADGIESIILDAGTTSLALAHKYNHPVHVCRGGSSIRKFRLLGPTCMEQDVVSRPIELPELMPGDPLVIYGTGCYSMAMASSFTHFRLGTVGWGEGEKFRWLRKPETIDHSIRLDVLSDRSEPI